MADIVVERSFATPVTEQAVAARIADADFCLSRCRVNRRASYLSRDGYHMLSRVDAPDAESVRLAMRGAGEPAERVWPGAFVVADPTVQPNVLATQRFAEPISLDEDGALAADSWSLDAHDIRRAAHILSRDRKRLITLYRAPDVASVWLAMRLQGAALEAIWAFRDIPTSGHPLSDSFGDIHYPAHLGTSTIRAV
jgi:hypothetical protein